MPAKVVALNAAERRHKLFDFRMDGWSAWRVVRNVVHTIASDLPLEQVGASPVTRVIRAIGHSVVLLRLLMLARPRDLIVKTCRSALRTQEGTKFRDVYFDGILIRRPSCLKLEVVNSEAFSNQARNAMKPADLDASVFTFWGRVLAFFRPRVEAIEFCERTSRLLRDELGIVVSHRFLLRLLSSTYWQARVYGLLLARVRPSVVMVADTGDHALRIASARRGVRFIELQHGVFDAAHGDAVPGWVEGSDAELLLPDTLACYGQFWIEMLAGTRLERSAAKVVGNELIDFARQQPRRQPRGGEIYLLVTSQGLDSVRLAKWLATVLAAAPEEFKWRLTIKLHPFYHDDASAFKEIACHPNVFVVPGSDSPNLWELLAGSDLHLSISSASHFDAAALGVPSVVIPLTGHERVLHAVDSVSIFLAHAPNEVWALARHVKPPDPRLFERYAVSGFVDNVLRLVDCPVPQPYSPRGRV